MLSFFRRKIWYSKTKVLIAIGTLYMSKRIIGLIDCNNFFASCEKVFRPDLANAPLVVLSNNDGCVISRSAEAKKLGIPMGIPLFKIKAEIQKYHIQVFSCNFALYGDLSNRIMRTLQEFAPCIEQYSIDEAFFDLTNVKTIDNYEEYGFKIKNYIYKTIGIPISVAFAPNKTLAKLANYAAKKYPKTGGVVNLLDPIRQRRLSNISSLDDVWGVGKQYQEKLQRLSIKTALDLAKYDRTVLSKKFGINLVRTASELSGEFCFELNENPPLRKQIMHSSTLGQPTSVFNNIKESLCNHVVKAAESMRKDGQKTSLITVFIKTNSFVEMQNYYAASLAYKFTYPTSDTRVLIKAAVTLLQQMWRDQYLYNKVGVLLSELTDDDRVQLDLFTEYEDDSKSKNLMELIDQLNKKNEQVFFLGQGISRNWKSQKNFKSPNYTTKWSDLIKVK